MHERFVLIIEQGEPFTKVLARYLLLRLPTEGTKNHKLPNGPH